MGTTILLDSDIVAYKFSAANEEAFDWDGDGNKHRVTGELEEATSACLSYVEELKAKLKADEVIVCLSCPTPENFRLKILPTYKGNRDPEKKPLQLSLVKQFLADSYPCYARPTLEADDIMGILATHPTLIKGRKVIVSEDKDMKCIPGWVFNPRKDQKPRMISTEFADYWHLYQTLVGDTTDNYKGCPGIGPKKAEACLEGSGDVTKWPEVVALFEAKGLTEEDALVQARVARILRHTDYDFKKKEAILWTPK